MTAHRQDIRRYDGEHTTGLSQERTRRQPSRWRTPASARDVGRDPGSQTEQQTRRDLLAGAAPEASSAQRRAASGDRASAGADSWERLRSLVPSSLSDSAMKQCGEHFAVVPRDDVQADALGADCGALTDLGAAAETYGVHLVDHGERARVPFGLALWEQAQVGDLRAHEQCRRAVGARRDARSAADAGRCIEGGIGVPLRDGDGVRLGSGSGRPAEEAAGLDDPIERATLDDEVLDRRERLSAPWLDVDLVTIREAAHVQLACRDLLQRPMRNTVDDQTAGAADALTAVTVERDRLVAAQREPLVQHIEHLQERHLRRDVLDVVADHASLVGLALLAPHAQVDLHL